MIVLLQQRTVLLERLGQLAWIPGYLDDLESDFSVFHRVDDIWALPGPVFFKRAWRLPAYRGVMRERYLAERDEEQPARPTRAAAPAGRPPPRHVVPATKTALSSEPGFSGIFSFGTGGGSG